MSEVILDFQKIRRVEALIQLKKYDAALKLVRELLAVSPEGGYLHYLHSVVLYNLGKLNQSKEAAERSLSFQEASGPFNMLGSIALRQRKLEEAEKYFLKALEAGPQQAIFFANLAKVYIQKGKYKLAEEQSREGLKLDPQHEECLNNLFAVYYLNKDDKSARKVLKENLANNPANQVTLSNRGFQLVKEQKHKEAEEAFRYVLSLNPQADQAQRGLKLALSLGNGVSQGFSKPWLLKPLFVIWWVGIWVSFSISIIEEEAMSSLFYYSIAISGAQVFALSWFGVSMGKWYAFGVNKLERPLFTRLELINASFSIIGFSCSILLFLEILDVYDWLHIPEQTTFLFAFYAGLLSISFGIRVNWDSLKPIARRVILTGIILSGIASLFVWAWFFFMLTLALFVLDWAFFKQRILHRWRFQ